MSPPVRSPTLWSVMVPFVSSEANELWNGVSPDLGLCKIGSFYGHSRVAISRLRRLRRRGMALGPAGGAGGAADEPRLDALGVEPVAAGRQHADALALHQLRETDGALRGARHRGRPGGEHHGPRQLRRSRPRPGLVPAGRRPREAAAQAAEEQAEDGVEGEGKRRGAHEHDEDGGHVGVEVLGAGVRAPLVRRRRRRRRGRRRKSGGGVLLRRRRHRAFEGDSGEEDEPVTEGP
ncbi:hypothetical protein BHE74_00006378 [Ensete ventricosum]|nr:hypothetical protein BHE74_00006378 [Ensete ventricosum]RZR79994.1 hypothetical protein BHM03_00005887 [Ensete ventricosum]